MALEFTPEVIVALGTFVSVGIGGVIAAARQSAKGSPASDQSAGHSSALLVLDDGRVRGLIDAVGLLTVQLNALGTDVKANSEITKATLAAIQQASEDIRLMTHELIRSQRG